VRGHIRKRGGSWEIKLDLERGGDGGRRTVYKTVRGSKRDAQLELARILAAQGAGVSVEPSKLTVRELFRERMTHWQASGVIGRKSAERYQQLIDAQIVPYLGDKLVQRLTTRDIEAWHGALLTSGRRDWHGQPTGRGLSARTVGNAQKILRKALGEAMRHEIVPRNVCILQRAPKIAPEEMRILTAAEIAGFEAAVHGHELEAPALVALYTGMRRGELLGSRWCNVDLDDKIIRVRESLEQTRGGLRFKSPKSRAGVRDITLPAIVVDVLHAHRKRLLERRLQLGQGKLTGQDLVFPTWDGQPTSPDNFTSRWNKVAREIGIPIPFHALRHTHASMLIAHGVDVVTIARRLGHASPTVTLSIYAHMFARDDSKAAAAIDAALNRSPGTRLY
jgi:integrase